MHVHTERMWSGVLTKPKKGNDFKTCCVELMNVPQGCRNDVEQKNFHLNLLAAPEQDAKA